MAASDADAEELLNLTAPREFPPIFSRPFWPYLELDRVEEGVGEGRVCYRVIETPAQVRQEEEAGRRIERLADPFAFLWFLIGGAVGVAEHSVKAGVIALVVAWPLVVLAMSLWDAGTVRRGPGARRRAKGERRAVLRVSKSQGICLELDRQRAERPWQPIAVRLQIPVAGPEVAAKVEHLYCSWFNLVSLVLSDGRYVPIWGCKGEAEARDLVFRLGRAARLEVEAQRLTCDLGPDEEPIVSPQQVTPLLER